MALMESQLLRAAPGDGADRVLLIEQDPTIARSLELMLASAGFRVERSRQLVMIGLACLTMLSVPAVLLGGSSDAQAKWLSLALFYVVAAAAVGGFAIFFSLAQDIIGRHTALLVGFCGATSWIVLSLFSFAMSKIVGSRLSDTVLITYGTMFIIIGYVVVLLSTNEIEEGGYYQGEYYVLLLSSVLASIADRMLASSEFVSEANTSQLSMFSSMSSSSSAASPLSTIVLSSTSETRRARFGSRSMSFTWFCSSSLRVASTFFVMSNATPMIRRTRPSAS